MDKGTTIWPEKIYTQTEVNSLLAKSHLESAPPASVTAEVIKTVETEKILAEKAVEKLVKKSNRTLASAYSVFPFDIFPDSINVEESRVTVVKRHMLSTAMHSVDLKDISNVFINQSIFFSQLEIVSRTFEDNEVKIKFLKNKEASFIRRMIEGLRTFENKQIDTSGYSLPDLVSKLEELATTEIVT